MQIKNERYSGPWDMEKDVVIVGAGGAGLAAAVEATNAGAETIVLEKQTRIWDSSTAISAGSFAFAGTDLQEKQGVRDSNDLFYKDIMAVGKQKNDPELVQVYIDHQLDTYQWLKKLGVRWADVVSVVAGMSVPRAHLTDPLELVRILYRTTRRQGALVFFQAPVTGLLIGERERVVGVNLQERTGANTRIRARKGVVLASGGFARDPRRLANINPKFAGVVATSGPGHTGDGLEMAEALGASVKDMEHVKPSFELHVNGTTSDDIALLFLSGGIIVNKKGERYVNESISYKDTGMMTLDQPGAIGYQIIDQKIFERQVRLAKKSSIDFGLGLDAVKIRLLVKGDTIEELANKIGVPPDVLRTTVDRYNSNVDGGRDPEFGRTTLAGNYGRLVKLDMPPFYSFETRAHFLSTYAGLAVDKDMRVLTRGGNIPGLYAAGEVVGGFHGAGYHSGAALGQAVIFGRIAGRNTAIPGISGLY